MSLVLYKNYITMEPRYNEPLYDKVLGITNDFLHPAGSKIYGKGPPYNETSIKRTHFAIKPLGPKLNRGSTV